MGKIRPIVFSPEVGKYHSTGEFIARASKSKRKARVNFILNQEQFSLTR